MKKLFLVLAMSLMCLCGFAQQEVIVKAGTPVPLKSVNRVAAADVRVGDRVLFTVSRDINVDGVTAIPYGTNVSGVVALAKKSSWWGTKGRLTINVNEIVMPNGTLIPLQNGQIRIEGINRTPISVGLFLFFVWPGCFLCGSKAEMQEGYEIQANVVTNTTLKLE